MRKPKGWRHCLQPFGSLSSLWDSSRSSHPHRLLSVANGLTGEPGTANCLVNRAGHRAFGALVPPALVHPLGVVLLADVRAPHDVPAAPVAAAHGLELIVRKLEARLLGEAQQLLGVYCL